MSFCRHACCCSRTCVRMKIPIDHNQYQIRHSWMFFRRHACFAFLGWSNQACPLLCHTHTRLTTTIHYLLHTFQSERTHVCVTHNLPKTWPWWPFSCRKSHLGCWYVRIENVVPLAYQETHFQNCPLRTPPKRQDTIKVAPMASKFDIICSVSIHGTSWYLNIWVSS